MERIILHIDMDYFFAQIEERESPQFKGKWSGFDSYFIVKYIKVYEMDK